ncbi:MAG: YigZ family protein [Acidobacteriota bacterium]
MRDHYRTPAAPAQHRQKIERSEFLGIAFHIESEDEFFAALKYYEKYYFDATHHCWAFRLFANDRARSSDAGEPSGTAGKPILGAIESADLFDIGLVVVRWFGGVKLGTGGLSRAYRDTAAETLRGATVADRYVYERIKISVPFHRLGDVYRLVAPPDVVLVAEEFGETNVFQFDVRRSRADEFTRLMAEKRLTPA